MRGPWHAGTADPLDQAVDVGQGNNFADWFPGSGLSPEAVLEACEEADEAEGCVRGTHLDEFHKRRDSKLS